MWYRREPFFLGGIWDCWHEGKGDGEPTFALFTTEPNELCAQIHDRMPVIIGLSDYERWLDPAIKDFDRLIPKTTMRT